MTDQYMLMFALGPVQPFIAQARKTRDLWIGSLLLSKLMEAAMAESKGQFVFPAKQVVGKIPDIPNKYVALFNSQEDARQAALKSIENIRALWKKVCQPVWESVIGSDGDDTTSTIWDRQTDFDFMFEAYWAIVPSGEGAQRKEYGVWLDETESLFAARKQLRDFQPQDEPGEKSTISGEREVLRTSQESNRAFWTRIAGKQSPNDINQEGKERLDAIDIVKRFAMKTSITSGKNPFPSTSSIVTASFMEALLHEAPGSAAFQQWRITTTGALSSKSQEAAKDIPYLAQKASHEWQWILQRDGDLYFPAIFAPRSLETEYGITDSADTIKRGKSALAALLKHTDECKITRPTPYYAVLQMDGDNMGMLLSDTKNDADHKKISQALSTFARDIAQDLVERQYPARLVYAGGDDVLAFAPLARDATDTNRDQPMSILALADELQLQYRAQVQGALPVQDTERIQSVTASIGIAVAHHYTSLSYVLRAAHAAESAAKRHYNRNALVMTILRRSGEQTQVGCHWYYPDLEDSGQPINLFSRFLTMFKDDILSPKCVHTLLEEVPALIGLDESALQSEIKRVLLRQLNLIQKDEEKAALQTEVKVLARRIVQLAQKMDMKDEKALIEIDDTQEEDLAIELHSSKRRYGIVEVLGWLLAMAFLARKDQE